jgi:L-alanine-DL-glutamate epimerase-like enolase superfamily enzyme
MDTAIIDVPWNGLAESLKIAAMADAYGSTSRRTTSTATSRP